jgi:hypothetical protein
VGFGAIMAKKPTNTNFQLGLTRQQLILGAQDLGKSLKSAKKASTKTLENYITKQLGGKGTKIPVISERAKRDIKDAAEAYGIKEGLQLLGNRIKKLTGNQDENNYLRLTAANALQSYYSGEVNKEIIDVLVSRLSEGDYDEIVSGLRNHKGYYKEIVENYADELIEKQVNELENQG